MRAPEDEVPQRVQVFPHRHVDDDASSSHGRTAVASPCSVWKRQTKPGLASAKALMGARFATKSEHDGIGQRRQYAGDVS
jgi:hypothetical protein